MSDEHADGAPVSRRAQLSLASAAGLLRFLMQPRDLGHPDACDFLAGNPQEMAMPEYVRAVQRAVEPDSPSYYSYGPPWRPAIEAVAAALSERLDLQLDPDDGFLTRGAASGLHLALRAVVDEGSSHRRRRSTCSRARRSLMRPSFATGWRSAASTCSRARHSSARATSGSR